MRLIQQLFLLNLILLAFRKQPLWMLPLRMFTVTNVSCLTSNLSQLMVYLCVICYSARYMCTLGPAFGNNSVFNNTNSKLSNVSGDCGIATANHSNASVSFVLVSVPVRNWTSQWNIVPGACTFRVQGRSLRCKPNCDGSVLKKFDQWQACWTECICSWELLS